MRRFLSILFVTSALVISTVGVNVYTVQAAVGDPCEASNGARGTLTAEDVCNVLAADSNAADVANGVTVDQSSAQRPLSFGAGFDKVIGTVLNLIMSIFAWLLGVAMIMLDYSVYYTVVTMGDYVQNLSGIGVAWRILRDIGNIALIFGFLAVGITTILNVNWYGDGKKFIPSLVIAAVLLNFSLFMTEAVIDTGNLFATQFYTQINGGVPAGSKVSTNGVVSSIGNEVISQKIMSVLGLQTIYGAAIKPNSQVFKEGNITFISLMGIGLFMVAAFVMFSLALMLITRFIALIFIIILSPIGLAGYAIPQLASTSKKWLDALVEQTITAPVLLLLLYIALRVITDVKFLRFGTTSPDYLGFVQEANGGFNLPGLASAILSFTVAMGLLLAVTYFSKQLGAIGADWATKTAGKLSFGATAMGMNAVTGGLSRVTRHYVQKANPTSEFGKSVQRGVSRVARYGESARMDIRSIPGIGAGLTLGGADEAAKPIEKSAGGRIRQVSDWKKKSSLESDQQYRQETVIPRLNAEVASALQTGNYKQVSTIISSMSDKDLETGAAQKALVNNPAAAALLPQARFDKLQSSDALSAAQKASLAQARKDGDDPANAQSRFSTLAANTFAATLPGTTTPHPFAGKTRGEALVGGMNTSARGKLGGNILTVTTPPPAGAPAGTPPSVTPHNAILDILDASDFDAIRREGGLTSAEKQAVGSYILAVATAPTPAGAAVPQRQTSLIAASAAPAFRAYYNL